MVKERLVYIDVAKGILMLFVVYGHIDGMAVTLGYSNHAIDDIHLIVNSFVSFYMACFFLITGYCSNFRKPFINFLSSSAKSIMIPAICFSFIFSGAWKFQEEKMFNFLLNIVKYGGGYWFLTTLFVARILYWLIQNYFSKKTTYCFCFFSFVIGFLLSPLPHDFEYWYFVHSLCLMPYLGLGQYIKEQNEYNKGENKWISLGIGRLVYFFFFFFGITVILARLDILHKDCFFDVPGVTYGFININPSFFVSLVLLSVLGSFLLIELSKMIRANMFLQFLGKNSLVIYCIHLETLRRSISMTAKLGGAYFESDYWACLFLLLLAYIETILLCCFMAWFFNLKYIRYLIGKF